MLSHEIHEYIDTIYETGVIAIDIKRRMPYPQHDAYLRRQRAFDDSLLLLLFTLQHFFFTPGNGFFSVTRVTFW